MSPEQLFATMEERLNQWLADNGKLRSPERTTVLKICCSLPNPFTMPDVVEAAGKEHISRATVYNAMPFLVNAGIVHCLKRQFGQKRDQYELLMRGKNIMQIICLRCGRVAEFREVAITNIVKQRQFNNFIPQHMSLYVYGTCKFCRRIMAKGGDGHNT